MNKDNFYKLQSSYDNDTRIDLKTIADVHFDIASLYNGGGLAAHSATGQ